MASHHSHLNTPSFGTWPFPETSVDRATDRRSNAAAAPANAEADVAAAAAAVDALTIDDWVPAAIAADTDIDIAQWHCWLECGSFAMASMRTRSLYHSNNCQFSPCSRWHC